MDAEHEINELKQDLGRVKNQVKLFEERLEHVEVRLKEARKQEVAHISRPTAQIIAEEQKKIIAPPPLPLHIEKIPKPDLAAPTEIHEATQPKPRIVPVARTEPSTRTWLKEWLKSIGPEEGLSWEMALGTFWLPRIGLLVLAVGIVLLTSVAINKWGQEYMPYIRVGIGYGIGLGLLILGRFLEKRDSSYAQLLLSGGFAFCHFVTFAAHYIEYTRIIESTSVTYLMLSVIVLTWGIYAHVRKSQLMAFMVTVLAHLTVAVATLTLPEPASASVAALIMLSVGSAFFMVYNRWYMVAALGMLGSYGNQFLWFYYSPDSTELSALLMALGVVACYGLVFALAEFFADEKLRREAVPPAVRTAYVSTNSGLFLGMSLLLMQGFDFSQDKTEYLYFGYAAAALLFGIAYLKLRDSDPLFNAYFTKASVAVTLGLAATLDGAALNLSLALESLALLVAARQTQFPLSRLLVQGAALLAIGHGLYCISNMPHYGYYAPEYAQQLLPAGLSILVLLGVSLLYHRTQWQMHLPLDYVKTPALRDLLKLCDAMETERDEQRAYSGQFWATLFALGAATLMAGYAYRLIEQEHLAAALGLVALALAGAGVMLRAKPFTLASLIGSAAAFLAWHLYAQNVGALYSLENGINTSFAYCMIAVASFLILSEFSRLLGKGADTWLYIPLKAAPQLAAQNTLTYLYALAGAWLYVGVVLQHTGENWYGVYFCMAAALGTVYALFFGASALGLASILLTVIGGIFTTLTIYTDAPKAYALAAICALAVVAFAGEKRYVGEGIGAHYHRSKIAPYLLYGMVAWLVFACIAQYATEDYQVLITTGCAIFALGLMRLLHPRALGLCATALLLSVSLFWFNTTSKSPDLWWHFCGVTVCLVALGADRYMAWLGTFKKGVPGGLLVFMSWSLLQYHINLGLYFDPWEYFALGLLMLAYLIYGAIFRSKTALTISVLGALMHSLRIIVLNYGGNPEIISTLMGFISLTGYWLLLERSVTLAHARGNLEKYIDAPQNTLAMLSYIVCGMMLATGVCVDALPLTIEWTIAAIVMMFLGYLFAQKYYRYAALATFALAIARAFIIDTQNLEAIYRIASMLVLGMVLLAVAFGYVQARKRQNIKSVVPVMPDAIKENPEPNEE